MIFIRASIYQYFVLIHVTQTNAHNIHMGVQAPQLMWVFVYLLYNVFGVVV